MKILLLVDTINCLKKLNVTYGGQKLKGSETACGATAVLLRHCLDLLHMHEQDQMHILFVVDSPEHTLAPDGKNVFTYVRHRLLAPHGVKYKTPYPGTAIQLRVDEYLLLLDLILDRHFPANSKIAVPGLEAQDVIAEIIRQQRNGTEYDRFMILSDNSAYKQLVAEDVVLKQNFLAYHQAEWYTVKSFKKEYPNIPVKDFPMYAALSSHGTQHINFPGIGKATAERAVNSVIEFFNAVSKDPSQQERLAAALADRRLPYLGGRKVVWKGLGRVQNYSHDAFRAYLVAMNTGHDSVERYLRYWKKYVLHF
jgi:hypothetical protein